MPLMADAGDGGGLKQRHQIVQSKDADQVEEKCFLHKQNSLSFSDCKT